MGMGIFLGKLTIKIYLCNSKGNKHIYIANMKTRKIISILAIISSI